MAKQIRLKDRLLRVGRCSLTHIDQNDTCPCYEQGCSGDGFVGPDEGCNLGGSPNDQNTIPADCPLEDVP